MLNENNENLELEKNEGAEEGEGEQKPKPELTFEQIQGIKRRELTKLAKELGVELPKKPEPETPKEEKKGFDYGGQLDRLYLDTKNVPEEDHD